MIATDFQLCGEAPVYRRQCHCLDAREAEREAARAEEAVEDLRREPDRMEYEAERLRARAKLLRAKAPAPPELVDFVGYGLCFRLTWPEVEMLEAAERGEFDPRELLSFGLRYRITIPAELFPAMKRRAAL